jgi:hypothetical protein
MLRKAIIQYRSFLQYNKNTLHGYFLWWGRIFRGRSGVGEKYAGVW